jgi:ribosomal protein S18 acetylase RimI-like enzyme
MAYQRPEEPQDDGMTSETTIRHLGPDDLELLLATPEGVFDRDILPDQARAFLADPLHHIVAALAEGKVIAMATGTVLLHPDKPPAFFIAEVGTHEKWQRRGIATRMTEALIAVARAKGCLGIWLATESENAPARALYRKLGARETSGIVVYDWDGAMDDE